MMARNCEQNLTWPKFSDFSALRTHFRPGLTFFFQIPLADVEQGDPDYDATQTDELRKRKAGQRG